MTRLEHAYQFANLGIPVFPIEVGGKKPLTKNGFKDATTSGEVILAWSKKHPNCNWAMATGEKSGILVVDIDPRDDGIESIKDLQNEHGELPNGPLGKTGGEMQGYHHYFRVPVTSHLRSGKLSKGIDIKTNGGYVIIPGSKTVNEYGWVEGRSITDVELPDIPGWIIASLNSKQDFSFDEEGFIYEGNRNNYLASLGGTLRRRGASYEAIEAALIQENKQRIKPRLTKDEVVRVAESMMNYEPDSDIISGFLRGEELDLDMRADADSSEKSLLGYLLSGVATEDFMLTILQGISGEYFVDSARKDIFKSAYEVWVEGVNPTPDHILENLKAKGTSIPVADINEMVMLSAEIVYIADVNFHIKRVREAWMLRQSVALFTYAATASQKGKRKPQDIVTETIGRLMELTDNGSDANRMKTTKDAVREVRQMLLDPDNEMHQMHVKTGLDFLDEMIIGLPKGELTVIAGRPSQGKTAFALKAAYSIAEQAEEDESVVFFSAEMTSKQLMMRNISRESKINSIKLRKGLESLGVADRMRVEGVMDHIDANVNMYIDESVSPSGQYMLSKVMGINAKKKVKAVVFDFLELAGLDEGDKWAQANKVLRIEQAIIALKTMAKIFDIPVIVISQLSRDVENRATNLTPPSPRASDLRWSGMIEQLANVIIMVHYPWFYYNGGIHYEQPPEKDYYELRVVKNRDGEIGIIVVRFIKQYGEYESHPDAAEYMEDPVEDLPWTDK